MKKSYISFLIMFLICGSYSVFAVDNEVYWLPDVQIDGEFDEWDGLDVSVTNIAVYGGTHDPKDAEGSFILATDGENLFIYADVRDDSVRLNTFHNSLAWKGDSIEVFFGTARGFREDYAEGDVQLRIVPRSDTDIFAQDLYVSYDYAGGDTVPLGEVAMQIHRRGYTVEAVIPLEDIGSKSLSVGQRTRCEFQVNDADMLERDRLLRWSSEEDDYYTPKNWGRCRVANP